MKIQPISDLHLDCQAPHVLDDFFGKIIQTDADIVIIAGDAVEGRCIDVFKEALPQITKPVYYVAGNHEFWGVKHTELHRFLKHELRFFPNVKVLEKEYVIIDDVVLIGATLWTNLHNPINANLVRNYMADFRQCPGLTTDWTNEEHDNSAQFIRNVLEFEQFRDKKKIVVTHHGPSFEAVDEYYKFDHANCGYQSNLNYFLYGDIHPDVWIHGHSHMFMDRMIGKTRVIRNPFGYQSYGEHNTGFKSDFMIDTDSLQELSKPKPKPVTSIWDDEE